MNKIALSGELNKGHAVYKNTTTEDRKVFDALNILPKSIERLYEVFVQIDRDGSGYVQYNYFSTLASDVRVYNSGVLIFPWLNLAPCLFVGFFFSFLFDVVYC